MARLIDTIDYNIFSIPGMSENLAISVVIFLKSVNQNTGVKRHSIELNNFNTSTTMKINPSSYFVLTSFIKHFNSDNKMESTAKRVFIHYEHLINIIKTFDDLISSYINHFDEMFEVNNKGEIIAEKVDINKYRERHCHLHKTNVMKVKILTKSSASNSFIYDVKFSIIVDKKVDGKIVNVFSCSLFEHQFVMLNRIIKDFDKNKLLLTSNILNSGLIMNKEFIK